MNRNAISLMFMVPVVAVTPVCGCSTLEANRMACDQMIAKTGPSAEIHWPVKYRPENAIFFAHNEIDVMAPPEVVWAILIEAESWPHWYEGAENVQILNPRNGSLQSNSVFTWRSMDLNLTSAVKEYQAPCRLSWESNKLIIGAYHAWLIVPTDFGCTVITEESQTGVLARLEKRFIPDKLPDLHAVWLREIKTRAERRVVN